MALGYDQLTNLVPSLDGLCCEDIEDVERLLAVAEQCTTRSVYAPNDDLAVALMTAHLWELHKRELETGLSAPWPVSSLSNPETSVSFAVPSGDDKDAWLRTTGHGAKLLEINRGLYKARLPLVLC